MSEILMPRLSDTMEEGVVSSWHKKPGDRVAVGDALVDIETDKALMEYEAYEEGVLGEILVPEGGTASIGTPIATLVTDGSASDTVPAPRPPAEPTPQPEPATAGGSPAEGGRSSAAGASPAAGERSPAAGGRSPSRPGGHPTSIVQLDAQRAEGFASAVDNGSRLSPGHAGNGRSRPPSSPLARRIARESGVDLTTVTGSGPGGRIVRADVEAAGQRAARDLALGQSVTDAGAQRLEGLKELQAAIDAAPNARAVMDLQARATTEQAMIANDQMRLQGIAMAQAAEDRLRIQRDQERAKAESASRMALYRSSFQ